MNLKSVHAAHAAAAPATRRSIAGGAAAAAAVAVAGASTSATAIAWKTGRRADLRLAWLLRGSRAVRLRLGTALRNAAL